MSRRVLYLTVLLVLLACSALAQEQQDGGQQQQDPAAQQQQQDAQQALQQKDDGQQQQSQDGQQQQQSQDGQQQQQEQQPDAPPEPQQQAASTPEDCPPDFPSDGADNHLEWDVIAMPDGSLAGSDRPDAAACQQACKEDPKCQYLAYFNYKPDGASSCFMRIADAPIERLPDVGAAGVNSVMFEVKEGSYVAYLAKSKADADGIGEQLATHAGFDAAKAACDGAAACAGFTHSEEGGAHTWRTFGGKKWEGAVGEVRVVCAALNPWAGPAAPAAPGQSPVPAPPPPPAGPAAAPPPFFAVPVTYEVRCGSCCKPRACSHVTRSETHPMRTPLRSCTSTPSHSKHHPTQPSPLAPPNHTPLTRQTGDFQYYIDVGIGQQQPSNFRMLIDSGSANIWVPAPGCTSAACQGRARLEAGAFQVGGGYVWGWRGGL